MSFVKRFVEKFVFFASRSILPVMWKLNSLRNSRHLATLALVSPPNDVFETKAEFPYWWRVSTEIWVVLMIGWIKLPTRHDQSEALPRSGKWRVIGMEFLRSFLRRHLAGKPVVASSNVDCFLRLEIKQYDKVAVFHSTIERTQGWVWIQTTPMVESDWESSRHFATPPLETPWNDVWSRS